MPTPLFSIIIATYNAGCNIEATIKSVIAMDNSDYELLIVDGGSKDNTVAVVENYKNHIAFFISEPDKGIYDAWNKGIQASKGRWICFLGAGDLIDPQALVVYQQAIKDSPFGHELEYVSGRVALVDNNHKTIHIIGGQWHWKAFRTYMTVAHVASIHARSLYQQYGLYNLDYKITGDYELLLRAGSKLKTAFCNMEVAKMLMGGTSTTYKSLLEQRNAKHFTGHMPIINANYELLLATIKFLIKKAIGFK